MARRPQKKIKTVQFFEIVWADGTRLAETDWQGLLSQLANGPKEARRHEGDLRTLIGNVHPLQDADHLVIAAVRERGDHPESVNLATDTIEELEVAEDRGIVESSYVSFLDFGNVIGFMRGTSASPHVSVVEEFINGLNLLGAEVEVRPIVDNDARQKLNSATGVDELEIRLSPSPGRSVAGGGQHMLAQRWRTEAREWTVTLSINAKTASKDSQNELLAQTRQVVTAGDSSVTRVRARLDRSDGNRLVTETVDFGKHLIAKKIAVQVRDSEGNPVRRDPAIQAILTAAAMADEELRRAVLPPAD